MIIGELVSENHVFSSQLQQFGRATVFFLAFCSLQPSMQANNFVVLEAPPRWQQQGALKRQLLDGRASGSLPDGTIRHVG